MVQINLSQRRRPIFSITFPNTFNKKKIICIIEVQKVQK